MEKTAADTLFDELNSAYEDRLNKLIKKRKISIEKYESNALQYLEDRIGDYGSDEFLQNSSKILESEFPFEAAICGRFDKYLYLSQCYYYLASVMPDRGRLVDGCKYLQEALYYCGLWQGAGEYEQWNDQKQKDEQDRLENAKEAKGKNNSKIKVEIIRLLECLIPAEGWSNKEEAVKGIEKELWSYIEKLSADGPPLLNQDNLPRTVKDWSRNDDAVKHAFAKAIIRKRKQ